MINSDKVKVINKRPAPGKQYGIFANVENVERVLLVDADEALIQTAWESIKRNIDYNLPLVDLGKIVHDYKGTEAERNG